MESVEQVHGQELSLVHYCARCLAGAAPNQVQCASCSIPFTGAGQFDLIGGPPPSREFAFLFEHSRN